MAVATGHRELTSMDIIGLVAANTRGRRLAPRLAAFMTTVTSESTMGAFQREVGQAVVESCTTELHDVGIATLVLSVARAAFAHIGIGHSAVIAAMLTHIRGNGLVTIETQCPLRAGIGAIMAVSAGVLLLYMGTADLAGHQQLFH